MAFLGFVVAWAAAIFGYNRTRRFVRERLRYVDSVHRTFVPFKVGLIAAVLATPIAWLLPVVSGGAAILFGVSVAIGVAKGRQDIRERRYLRA